MIQDFRNGLFTFHADTPGDWLRMTRPYTLKNVAGQITCPMLVCDSEDDTNMAGQARKLYNALQCPKDFILFTRQEGAEEHCQMGAMNISSERILGWLDRTLAAPE